MKFVFLSYGRNPAFSRPEDWIQRIRGYTGILETLSKKNQVISIEQINYEGIFFDNGVDYRFLRFKKWESKFPYRLHQYVKSLEPDIVFVHGMHFAMQIIQLKKVLSRNTKIMVQNHAEKPGSGQKLFFQKRADAFINAYLFTSVQMGDVWIRKGIIRNQKKIMEVMEASSVFAPIEKNRALENTGITNGPVFLWVGRLDQNKDPGTVVKSFLKFLAYQPKAKLYMIFHTDELIGEIKQILQDADVGKEAVAFVGKVTHENMLYWYNSADFIISGSHYEGSGVAICEAMSCGCIPIVTNILSFIKITDNGRCGFLYEPGNEKELLSVLLKTMKMDTVTLRQKVLEQFQSFLSFEAIAQRIQEIADSL